VERGQAARGFEVLSFGEVLGEVNTYYFNLNLMLLLPVKILPIKEASQL